MQLKIQKHNHKVYVGIYIYFQNHFFPQYICQIAHLRSFGQVFDTNEKGTKRYFHSS